MTPRAAAGRYARALLEVSVKEADPQRVERELAGFVGLLESHEPLRKVLLNPAVPVTRKRAVLAALLDRDGTLSPVVGKLLLLLAERDRLALLPDLIVSYRERLLEHLQIARAEVTTAVPLGPERAQALERSLAKATGKRVSLVTRVDPAIIGGVVTRLGSIVYDGSVTRQLERLKEKLTEGG